jgi:hypothetical protein
MAPFSEATSGTRIMKSCSAAWKSGPSCTVNFETLSQLTTSRWALSRLRGAEDSSTFAQWISVVGNDDCRHGPLAHDRSEDCGLNSIVPPTNISYSGLTILLHEEVKKYTERSNLDALRITEYLNNYFSKSNIIHRDYLWMEINNSMDFRDLRP